MTEDLKKLSLNNKRPETAATEATDNAEAGNKGGKKNKKKNKKWCYLIHLYFQTFLIVRKPLAGINVKSKDVCKLFKFEFEL